MDEANAKVEVKWGATTKTVTADASGNWKADFSKAEVPADGETTVTVQATDVAGNTSAAQTKSVSVDTTAVSAPSIEQVSDDVGSIKGTVADKGYTDDTTPTVRVKLPSTPKVAVAGDKVQLFDGASELGAAVVLKADDITRGYVDITPTTALTVGSHSFSAKITDVAGNVSSASASYGVTIDTSVAKPTLTLATDSGSSGSDALTNVKTVNVGNIEAGAGWEYQVDGGAWTRGNLKLSDVTLAALGGTIAGGWSPGSLKAAAVDLQTTSGNTKTVWLVGFDGGNTKGVQLDFAEDANGRLTARVNQAAFASGDHRSDWATTGKTTVDIATGDSASGYGLKGLTINGVPGAGGGYLNLGRTAVGDAFLLSEGEHKYLVRQTDMAGNVSAASAAYSFTLDTSAIAPIVELLNDTGASVTDLITKDSTLGLSNIEIGATVEYSSNGTTWTSTPPASSCSPRTAAWPRP